MEVASTETCVEISIDTSTAIEAGSFHGSVEASTEGSIASMEASTASMEASIDFHQKNFIAPDPANTTLVPDFLRLPSTNATYTYVSPTSWGRFMSCLRRS